MQLVTEEEFNTIIECNPKVISMFSAEWCSPCKAMKPVIERMAKTMNDYKFVQIDIESCGTLGRALGIRSVPTVVMFKNGYPVTSLSGSKTEAELTASILQTFT